MCNEKTADESIYIYDVIGGCTCHPAAAAVNPPSGQAGQLNNVRDTFAPSAMDLSTREDLSRLLRPLSPTFSFRSCLLIAVRVDVCPAVAGPPNNNNNKRHSSLYVSVMLKKERISLLSKFLSLFCCCCCPGRPLSQIGRQQGRDCLRRTRVCCPHYTSSYIVWREGRMYCTVYILRVRRREHRSRSRAFEFFPNSIRPAVWM